MTEQIPSPVIEQVKRLRAAQAARETAELQRLVDAYAAINKAARADAEALALQIIASGKQPTEAQLRKMSRYRELMDTVENELAEYQTFMRVELRGQSTLAITEGERDARTLASLSARGAGLDVQMRVVNMEVIEQLVGFLDPRGPLYERLGMLGGWTSEQVSAKVIESIAKGLNPRTTAAMLTERIGDAVTGALGMGLTDALRMMRTCQLWSYREANRASYLANQDVVTGWVWYAELDGLTCGSCIAMHGSQHTLNETLNDHHNGRCTMLPVTIGEAPDLGLASGEEWFNTLNEEEQRAILGKGKFEAWKEGKFTLADLPTEKADAVYGKMRTVKTLEELTGGNKIIANMNSVISFDPFDIEPINKINDEEKYKALVMSMKSEGWAGRDLLVIKRGEQHYALTGSHRLYAAREAGIKPNINLLDISKLTDEQTDDLINLIDDDDRVKFMKNLYKDGLVTRDQYDLMQLEITTNTRDFGKSYKTQAALYDAKKAEEKAKLIEDAMKAKIEAEKEKIELDKIANLSQEKKNIDAFIEKMHQKYKNIWQDMTEDELEKLEELERKLKNVGK